jgi:phage baseplate assembly protein W
MRVGTQKILDGFRRAQVQWGDTLQRLAARELGDAARWASVAAINRLVPPYLTGDAAAVRAGVLLYGDTLIVPAVDPEPSPGKTAAEDVFLRDVALVAGPSGGALQVTDGDIALVAGRANLRQALAHRVQTERGELIFHARYGCRVHEQKGRKNTAVAGLLSALFVREAVAADPRVRGVLDADAAVDGDVIRVQLRAQPISGHPVDARIEV